MEEAERIAREEHGSEKLAVISGVGTRHYYRKLGYGIHVSLPYYHMISFLCFPKAFFILYDNSKNITCFFKFICLFILFLKINAMFRIRWALHEQVAIIDCTLCL
jgi:hypothetical protein